MNEKLSQFFKGKMSKSVYIPAISTVICGAVIITSTVIVHEKNKKIDSILNNTVSSGSTTESATENTLSTENNILQNASSATSAVSSEDKAMQYLKEYDRLTAEYEKKRAKLTAELNDIADQNKPIITVRGPQKPSRLIIGGNYNMTDEEISKKQAEADALYEEQLSEWEKESISQDAEESKARAQSDKLTEQAHQIENQIEQLEKIYQSDINALKKQYGIK